MKRHVIYPIIAILIVLSSALSACQSPTGVPQAQYDQLDAQLQGIQAKLTAAEDEIAGLRAENAALDSQLMEARATISALQGELGETSLTGATPAETAGKIVKYYHETHVYTTYDLFICSDMAAEVWNMLKAQGIGSVIAVGDVDKAINDIVLSDHAWVLAEVEPGRYLALETTGGFTVPESEKPLYYRGWVFESPASLKSHNDLIREYNVRVTIRNQMAAADRDVVDEYNQATSQARRDQLEAVHDQLVELIEQQEAELNGLMAQINSLARPI